MKKYRLKQFDILEIIWVDSLSDENRWERLQDYDFNDLRANLTHMTVGYLMKESNEAITLAQSVRENKIFILGVITTPKGCIKKIRKIPGRK